MVESNKLSRYELSRNGFLDYVQNKYTQKRIEAGTASDKSTSAFVFNNLKKHGVIKGLAESATDLKQFYDTNIQNIPEEDMSPLPPAIAWIALSVGALQIMLTVAGYKNIDQAGHWEGFLPISQD